MSNSKRKVITCEESLIKINSLLLIGSHGGPEALQEKLNLEFYMQQNYSSKMKEIKMHRANSSVADLPTL